MVFSGLPRRAPDPSKVAAGRPSVWDALSRARPGVVIVQADEPRDLLSRLPSRLVVDLRVQVAGDRRSAVPETVRNPSHGDATGERERRCRVSKVVEAMTGTPASRDLAL